jgi:hypothetical protein
MFKYSDEDYSTLLSVADWTRKDTDSLMALVQRFGMNFVMVHDRYTSNFRHIGWSSYYIHTDRLFFPDILARNSREEYVLVHVYVCPSSFSSARETAPVFLLVPWF